MNKGWKGMASELCIRHHRYGASMVPSPGAQVPDVEGDLFDEHRDGQRMEVEGRQLKSKEVARWMWENRVPALGADCVWSVYDEETGKSYVGWGILKKPTPQEV